jgi:hypothetical protein
MRLLNTSTMEMRVFGDSDRPPYAILSHTWRGYEMTLPDLHAKGMENLHVLRVGDLRLLKEDKDWPSIGPHIIRDSYSKIRNHCAEALRNGYAWAWVDTCSIDKSSSAELSEAINSMFRWYQEAEVCYAFLDDINGDESSNFASTFSNALWFKRGWTLQELIAPDNVTFYDRNWKQIGTKRSLRDLISKITGIKEDGLNYKALSNFSVAQKMSWASRRKTTRIEDTAYCLMGIFEVNIPLLYGEGNKAFFRLQEEIMKRSRDHTLFAWPYFDSVPTSVLASSPEAFSVCGNVVRHEMYDSSPYSMTNMGIRIEVPIHSVADVLGSALEPDSQVHRLSYAILNARGPTGLSCIIFQKNDKGILKRQRDLTSGVFWEVVNSHNHSDAAKLCYLFADPPPSQGRNWVDSETIYFWVRSIPPNFQYRVSDMHLGGELVESWLPYQFVVQKGDVFTDPGWIWCHEDSHCPAGVQIVVRPESTTCSVVITKGYKNHLRHPKWHLYKGTMENSESWKEYKNHPDFSSSGSDTCSYQLDGSRQLNVNVTKGLRLGLSGYFVDISIK